MDKKEQLVELITLMVNYRSRFIGNEFPLNYIAVNSLIVNKSYINTKKKYRDRYNNKTQSFITSAEFEKLKSKLLEEIRKAESEVRLLANSEYLEESKVEYQPNETGIREKDSLLKHVLKNFDANIGEKLILRTVIKDQIELIIDKLNLLGSHFIHLDTLKEVESSCIAYGVFLKSYVFSSVPKACEFYRANIHQEFDIDNSDHCNKLKEWVQEYAHIESNNDAALSMTKIRTRLNAWISHQKSIQFNRTSRT